MSKMYKKDISLDEKIINASDVKPRKVDWLIKDLVPKNQTTLMVGREGIGKSALVAAWVAQASIGALDGTFEGVDTLIVNLEDDIASIQTPRLIAAGADLDKVHFLDEYLIASDLFFACIDDLQRFVVEKNIKIIILDPIISLMEEGSSIIDAQDVRKLLNPLKSVCEVNNVTIIGVHHMNKGESNTYRNRALGSGAWMQGVRNALFLEGDIASGKLVVSVEKNNLIANRPSYEYELKSKKANYSGITMDVPVVINKGKSDITAEQLTNNIISQKSRSNKKIELAKDELEKLLPVGEEMSSKKVKESLEKKGFSSSTTDRAFKALGGVSTRKEKTNRTIWSLNYG